VRLLLDLLLHSRDDVVEPAEPALLHLVGGLALGLIQNLSVDLRLEALFSTSSFAKVSPSVAAMARTFASSKVPSTVASAI